MKRRGNCTLKLTWLSKIIQQSSLELCCATSCAVNVFDWLLHSLCMHPFDVHSRHFFTSTCVCIAVPIGFIKPFASLICGNTLSSFQQLFQTFMRTTPLLFGDSYKQSGLCKQRVNRVHPEFLYAMAEKLSIRSETR